MPGTRNRKGDSAESNETTETNAESSEGSQSKKSKKETEGSDTPSVESSALATSQRGRKSKKETEGSDTPSVESSALATSQRGRKSAVVTDASREAPVPPDSSAESQTEGTSTLGASAPAASPRKRGRPRKDERKSEMAKGSSEKTHATAPAEAKADKTKMAMPAKAKSAEVSSGDVFSPRRSSRGFIPNRRFQDMELDFGRKRPKEERTDEPSHKRPRMSGKKEQMSKGERTPVQRSSKDKSGSLNTKDSKDAKAAAVSVSDSGDERDVSIPSPAGSPQLLALSLASTAQPSSTLTAESVTGSSSQQSSGSAAGLLLSSALTSTPSLTLAGKAPPSSKSSLTSTPSLTLAGKAPPSSKSSAVPSLASKAVVQAAASSKPPVTVISSLSPPTSSVVTATRTVAITSSRAVLARAVPPRQDPVAGDVASKQTPEENSGSPAYASDPEPTESSASEGATKDDLDSDVSSIVDLRDSASVIEVAVISGQSESSRPRVVNISHTNRTAAEKGKATGETPGRVVGKPTTEPSSVSKSVFIVRNPPHQSTSVPVKSDKSKSDTVPSLSSAGASASKVTVTTVAKEAATGDVTSMVEVSPNKKVPVVLAERRENAALTGKVVKVISAQQVQQLPLALQKMVSSQILQQKSLKQSSQLPPEQAEQETCEQQPQKIVTVHVSAAPLQSPSAQRVVSSDDCSRKSSTQSKTDKAAQKTDNDATTESPSSEIDSTSDQTSMSSDDHCPDEQTAAKAPIPTSTSTTTNTTDTGRTVSIDMVDGSDGDSQNQTQISEATKKDLFNLLHSDDDDEEDSDEEEEEVMQSQKDNEKYASSGTQTPYTKSNTRRVITVHVHPPSKEGEKNREVVTVTKVEKEETTDSIVEADEREDMLHHETKTTNKGKYIFVDLPEGTTVKQQYVRTCERYDSDPNFYTVDEHGMYTCHICQYQTSRRPNFYKHKKKHLGLRPYACDQCQYRAATSSNLKRHMEIHRDIRNHKCHLCDLYFRQKIHLERHIKYRHEEKKVKCPLCDYVCANENPDLKVHIKRRHVPQMGSDEAMSAFKCPECGIIATSKRDLRQHLKFHSKGPELKLFCNMCSFVTDCESRLRRHQYIHTKEKPFQCGLCDYRGSQKEHVLRHMRTQHNIEITRKQRTKKSLEREGEGSKGSEKADYTSEEKIFACNHCTMKFSKLINLYKHLHTQHRDIMPSEQGEFSCVVCDFHTTNKKNLLVHMRRHNVTDQSPPSHVYSCVLCRYMNPKRRNLFQHMRKKHHIDIVVRDDGSTTCYVTNDPITATATTGSLSLSPQQSSHSAESIVNVLPLADIMTTIAQPTDLQVSNGSITVSSGSVPTTIKMEDIALVVSNPQSSQGVSGEGEETLVDTAAVETITIGGLSQDAAAEAIQGLQALAQRGVLDAGSIVEEQVQVMGSDDQTTLVIDPAGMGVVEQLVQPKTEPLEVVEIENSQLLEQVTSTSIISEEEVGILGDPVGDIASIQEGPVDGSGLQLSAEQLMNLTTGDYLEINGEMYKVEVSTENNPDGSQGQQIISFEPATAPPEILNEQLESSQVDLESSELS